MNMSRDTGDKITPKPAFQGSIDMVVRVIIAIQVVVAVYGFAVLPDIVPIHWGGNGQANGYGPKWMGTFLYPLMSTGIYVLIRVLMVAGPRLGGREHVAVNLRIGKMMTAGVMLLLLIIQLSTIAQTLVVGFNMTMVVMLALSVLFIFMGNYMGKVRRTFWMGIRTPWTLASSVVWERTHRLGGWLFVAAGLIGIPCSFIPPLQLWGILVPIIAISIYLYLYSYICYQRVTPKQNEPLSPQFDEDNI